MRWRKGKYFRQAKWTSGHFDIIQCDSTSLEDKFRLIDWNNDSEPFWYKDFTKLKAAKDFALTIKNEN